MYEYTWKPVGDYLARPMQNEFTDAKLVAMLSNKSIQERAINILKHHQMIQPNQTLPKARQGVADQCQLAEVTGIPGTYDLEDLEDGDEEMSLDDKHDHSRQTGLPECNCIACHFYIQMMVANPESWPNGLLHCGLGSHVI